MSESVEICDGWSVEWDAPTLRILEDETVVFESHKWNPNMSDPEADALGWASVIADESSGLTAEDADDPAFTAMVAYVRSHAPRMFADECAILSEEAESAAETASSDAL